jgi:hypothetical protein
LGNVCRWPSLADGTEGSRDGIAVHNLLATFSHQRSMVANPWAQRFVAFIRAHKSTLVSPQPILKGSTTSELKP